MSSLYPDVRNAVRERQIAQQKHARRNPPDPDHRRIVQPEPVTPVCEIPLENSIEAEAAAISKFFGHTEAAKNNLRLDREQQVAAVRSFLPATWATLKARHLEAEAIRAEIDAGLKEGFAAVALVEQTLVDRGTLRADVADKQARLQAAKDFLATPASMHADEGALLKAQQIIQHMPGEIAAAEARIDELTILINGAVDAAGIDLTALRNDIAARAGKHPTEQRIMDPPRHRLATAGYLD